MTFANKSKFIQVDAAISLAAAGQLLGRCFSEQEKGNESRWISPKAHPGRRKQMMRQRNRVGRMREKRKQGKERQREVSCDNGDRQSFVDGTQ